MKLGLIVYFNKLTFFKTFTFFLSPIEGTLLFYLFSKKKFGKDDTLKLNIWLIGIFYFLK